MNIHSYNKLSPQIGKNCFLAPSCDLIGDITIGNDVSVWFQVVIRADVDKITIGDCTNIQDLSMLHVTEEYPLSIAHNVTVGHKVLLHGATIMEHSLIGMGAIIMDGATIPEYSVVAAGSVVPPGKTYPPESLILGNPAKVKRKLTQEEIDIYSNHYKNYLRYKNTYLNQN